MPQQVTTSVREQVRRNAVALISLVIAIMSLSYNSWRNELSEENRTQRAVSMEVLMRLGDLQQVVWHHHYDKDYEGRGNLRTGWTLVIVIRDISTVLDEPVPTAAAALAETWATNSEQLDSSKQAKDDIIAAIETVRRDTVTLLEQLD